MKGYKRDNEKEFHNASLEKPPYAPGIAMTMSRASPRGMDGDSKPLTDNAKYGVDGYDGPDKIVEMPRSTMEAMGGSGASSLPPGTAKYGTEGAGMDYPDKQCYGVSGVDYESGGKGPKRSILRPAGGTR